LLLLTNYNRIF